jgi:hypothetical protein
MSFNWESHREALVEEQTKHLMSEGQKFHPFTIKNFTEAMQNLSYTQYYRMVLNAGSYDMKRDNLFLREMTADCLMSVMDEYWRKPALAEAEKETPSAEEMQIESEKALRDARGF